MHPNRHTKYDKFGSKGVLLWTNVLICFISYLLELLIVKIKMVLEWREGGQLGAKKTEDVVEYVER